jgi:RNA polymerase sigma-70 factor (ECF subfamily)
VFAQETHSGEPPYVLQQVTTALSNPALLDSSDLAERIRARDPDALQVVVETYLPQILRAARGAGLKPHEAEDVAQNTFTTFVESAERFEGRSHVRTWIFGILYRKISETRRKLGKDRQVDDIDEVFESRFDENGTWSQPPRTADAALEAKQTRQEIADCLEAAPSKQRMAFVLREAEGLSSEEICKILEVSSTNLGVMLFRLRNRVRECLEAKWAA